MYLVETFLEHYGMPFLVLVGFAEFIGLPLAAGPPSSALRSCSIVGRTL
jgi:hypothetical protein